MILITSVDDKLMKYTGIIAKKIKPLFRIQSFFCNNIDLH
jgi:hypothetical protein